MRRAVLPLVRAASVVVVASLAVVACTANVQDLGNPEPPSAPLNVVDHACLTWPLHGKPCTDDGPMSCNPTSTLQCICGVDHTWVCLDATLGLLSPHGIAAGNSCSLDVVYESATSLCWCGDDSQLACRARDRIDRGAPEPAHAPSAPAP